MARRSVLIDLGTKLIEPDRQPTRPAYYAAGSGRLVEVVRGGAKPWPGGRVEVLLNGVPVEPLDGEVLFRAGDLFSVLASAHVNDDDGGVPDAFVVLLIEE